MRAVLVILAFTAATMGSLWFQVGHIGMTPEHHDVLFSIWRLAWFAHQIVRAPLDLFNANIFYPEPRTLAFSDAIPFESAVAAPLFWSHVNPVVTYNLLILASFVAAGSSMFLLARSETGSVAAGWVAGVIFAFAPFRFQHYIHLELLWDAPIPLAFWAFHRTIRDGRLRDGVLTGVFVALQMCCAIYYGMFLMQALLVAAVVHAVRRRGSMKPRAILALGAAAVVALAVIVPYSTPYRDNARALGDRSQVEVQRYSATGWNYLASPAQNRLYGWTADRWGANERFLFLGLTAMLLAVYALRRPVDESAAVYLVVLIFAIDSSLGMNGLTFPLQHRWLPLLRGLRVPARWGALVVFASAALAGQGTARLVRRWPGTLKTTALVTALTALLFAEYAMKPLELFRRQTTPSEYARWLQQQPPSVIAELPMPYVWAFPGKDALYEYTSIFHWHSLVNGYSGYYPRSYITLLRAMERFPDAETLGDLRARRVRYIVLHKKYMEESMYQSTVQALARTSGVRLVNNFLNGDELVEVYELAGS